MAMKSSVEIVARFDELMAKSTKMFDRIKSEKRKATPEERAQLDAMITEAKGLEPRYKKAKQEASMSEALRALDLPAGGRAGVVKAATMPARVKASGGSTWGAAVVKESSGPHEFKGLLASGSVPVTVPLDPDPVRMDVPVLTLRQLIPAVVNSTSHFSYMRQVVREHNAGVVAAGERKPTSRYQLERFDDRVRTIAHLSEPVNKFDLSDASMLQEFIDAEMRDGLELALEHEIINGDGTGEHFTGLNDVSGHIVQEFVEDLLTTTRKAVTKLDINGYTEGAGWVMHPDDWEAVELLRDNEARFYYSGPVEAVQPVSRRLWSVPVVTSISQEPGTAHLVDFSRATRLQVRQEGMLDWSENVYRPDLFGTGDGGNTFEANQVVFRFEGRFGLEIKKPSAIVRVELDGNGS